MDYFSGSQTFSVYNLLKSQCERVDFSLTVSHLKDFKGLTM